MTDEEYLLRLAGRIRNGIKPPPEAAARLLLIEQNMRALKKQEIEFINILAEERARPQREPACKGGIWVYERTPPDSKTQKGATGNGILIPCRQTKIQKELSRSMNCRSRHLSLRFGILKGHGSHPWTYKF
jgi:hypothetical protein